MPQTVQQKIQRLFRLKGKPELELFRIIQEFEQNAEKALEVVKKEAVLATKQALSEELERFRNEMPGLVDKAVQEHSGGLELAQTIAKNILKDVKGEKGESPQKGVDYWTDAEINEMIDKVHSRIRVPKDGAPGEKGETPVAGVDYPTPTQIRKMVMVAVSKLPAPKDGKTPVKGVDYFTQKDIDSIIEQVRVRFPRVELKPEEIRDKLQSLKGEQRLDAFAIKNLPKFMGEVKRTLHRGGLALEWEAMSGTPNGVTTAFTISYAPYTTSTLMVFVSGMMMRGGGEDYTISGRTITFNTAPPTNSILWAFYRKK